MSAASSSSSSKEPKLRSTFASLPTTKRGYGIILNSSGKDQRLVYASGKLVILRSLANPADSIIFTEHKYNVTCAVFSPSGFWVASGDDGGNVIIWSWPQMKIKNNFAIQKSVLDLDWDESSTRIVAVGDGANKAKVFSWDSGNNLGEITMHSQPILSCSYRKQRPFRIVTASEDLTVNLYEGPPFKYTSSYKGHTRYPNLVKYSPSGDHFLSVGSDSKIVLFEGKTAEVVKEFESKENGHSGAIYAFAWSPDGKQILTASADRTAKIWNIDSGSVTHTFKFGNGNDIGDMQVGALWTADYLITVSLSGAINYLDESNPSKLKRVIHGHQNTISSIALDTKSGLFYTSGLSGEITVWNFSNGDSQWLTGKGHGGKVVQSIAVTADGKGLISVGFDNKIRISDAKSNTITDDAADLSGGPVAVAASSKDAGLAVVVLKSEKVEVIRKGQVVHSTDLKFVPNCVCFNSDNTRILVGGKDKKIHVYDIDRDAVKAGEVIASHDKPLAAVKASTDGRFIASVDAEASVYVHSADKFALQNKTGWRFHQAGVLDCDWSPSGHRLVTGSLDASIIVWSDFTSFQGSERVRVANAHAADVSAVRFWDDKTIITVGADKNIRIWDLPA